MTSDSGNIEAIYPLTPVQDGILFHSVYSPDAPLYFQQYTCLLEGALEPDDFKRSWEISIERHPTLRSMLAWVGREQPLQVVRGRVDAEWRMEDWRTEPPESTDRRLEAFLEADRERGFRLDAAPLMRFALFRVDERRHRFVWSHHHVILDGWSLEIVLDEVLTSYADLRAGREVSLPPAARYRDYVRWLRGRDLGTAEGYWRSELRGVDQATRLPIEAGPARSRWTERHGEVTVVIDRDGTRRLRAFARERGLTVNTLLRGAWAIVLGRYSGRDDVVFGATVSGRPPELDGSLEMVGLFINTIPVRVRLQPDRAALEWLHDVQERQVAASPYESTPLAAIQSWSEVPSGEPLFETLLAFENVARPETAAGEIDVTDARYLQRSNYPLAVLAMPGDEIEIIMLFDLDRFEGPVIRRMGRQLAEVLRSIVEDPARPLRDLAFFPQDELREIVMDWNATDAPYPRRQRIHDLFSAAAERAPESIAVTGDGHEFTYDDLRARAGRIAEELRGLGVKPNDRIAIAIDRSPAMAAAIFGVLQAGGAYVPIDPSLPASRAAFLVADTRARALVAGTGVDLDGFLRSDPPVPVVRIDAAGMVERGPSAPLPADDRRNAAPDDLAYVMYTSGSTGKPKGVAVTHRNLVNSTHARIHAYGEPVERFLLLSPYFFDSSVAGIFSSLTQGGTLVVPAPRMEQDVGHLADLIESHRITHTLALPSVYRLILELSDVEKLRSLRLVMVAGEPCPPSLVDDHYGRLPTTRLVNEYGPTEATVWCTVHHVDRADRVAGDERRTRVPIGRPIANTQVYILDDRARPTPVGVPGELHVGGTGVALGYLGNEASTSERFVERDIPGGGPTRLYRTGDVARYLDDGTIDLLGRVDDQVKLRGQRIELGEVEMVLREHPAVRDAAVVLLRSDGEAVHAAESLVAYVEGTVDAAELRGFAARRLPEVMVPTTIVELERLPHGATGKIDRSALPPPSGALPRSAPGFVNPTGPAEETLASIWAEVLGRQNVGATDNFFELGGDSISSIRVIARAHQAGLRITPKQFFDHPTVAGQAEAATAVE